MDKTCIPIQKYELDKLQKGLGEANNDLRKASVRVKQETIEAKKLIEAYQKQFEGVNIKNTVSILTIDAKKIKAEVIEIMKDKKITLADMNEFWELFKIIKDVYSKSKDSKVELKNLDMKEIGMLLTTIINEILILGEYNG